MEKTVESGGSDVLDAYDVQEVAADKEVTKLLWARRHPVRSAMQQIAEKRFKCLFFEAIRRHFRRITARHSW